MYGNYLTVYIFMLSLCKSGMVVKVVAGLNKVQTAMIISGRILNPLADQFWSCQRCQAFRSVNAISQWL